MSLKILGISGLYHDSAAALVIDGEIIAAAQEERFTRKKHDLRLPANAIKYCLDEAKITPEDLDYIIYYDNPLLTLDRFIKNAIALGEDSKVLIDKSFDTIFSEKLWIHKDLEKIMGKYGSHTKFLVTEHHISHAASAYYPSPFNNAVIITVDGVGEWATTTIGIGKDNKIDIKEEIRYPHSIGLLYSAFTYFCGFKVNSGDYKFMGLAPYGKPIYYDIIKEKLIDIKPDGSYRLNMEYFNFHKGLTMTNDKFEELFEGPRRKPESTITKREMDIAASGQKIVEEILLLIVKHAKIKYGNDINNLVLAGGVALNCVANGKILESKIFDKIWIQPAAGDAGGALGCALYTYYQYLNHTRKITLHDFQKGSYLGPQFSENEIKMYLDENHYVYEQYKDTSLLYSEIAHLLEQGKVIGLFHGRMEYGPRALGNRSIIADPRSSLMQSKLNLKIKFRESFRPFAPSILRERLEDYFEMKVESPYMLLVAPVQKKRRMSFDLDEFMNDNKMNMLPVVNECRSDIPAVTHVDYSARIQTVDSDTNLYYYNIIKAFENLTGCPVVVNTSFNVRGEPIVCTPKEAYECFMRTEMDVLIMENYVLYKHNQENFIDNENWREKYELD